MRFFECKKSMCTTFIYVVYKSPRLMLVQLNFIYLCLTDKFNKITTNSYFQSIFLLFSTISIEALLSLFLYFCLHIKSISQNMVCYVVSFWVCAFCVRHCNTCIMFILYSSHTWFANFVNKFCLIELIELQKKIHIYY